MTSTSTGDRAAAAGRLAAGALRALPGVVGLALVAFGFWLAWPPLGFIAAGALLLVDRVATLVSRSRADRS